MGKSQGPQLRRPFRLEQIYRDNYLWYGDRSNNYHYNRYNEAPRRKRMGYKKCNEVQLVQPPKEAGSEWVKQSMLTWVRKNKTWIFSGVGVVIPGAIGTFCYRLFLRIDVETTKEAAKIAASWFFWCVLALIASWILYALYKKHFLIFAKYKLKELMHILVDEPSIDLEPSVKYDCFELNRYYFDQKKKCGDDHIEKVGALQRHHDEKIGIINEFVCIVQGEIAQFTYLAGELHKPIKKELKQEHPNPELLEKLCIKMETDLFNLTVKVFDKLHPLMVKFFDDRSKKKPRCCVRCYSENELIVDFWRKDPTKPHDSKISTNTGCDYISKNGLYYLCNDIPGSIKQRQYRNPRIDIGQVRDYLRESDDFKDKKQWLDCWFDYKNWDRSKEDSPPENSFYTGIPI